MQGWPIDFVQADTLREFFTELEKKKRVLRATRSWHKFHFEIDMPFIRGPSLTLMIEEQDGVYSIVVLPVRRVFDEEDALGEWPFARWFSRCGAGCYTTDNWSGRSMRFITNSMGISSGYRGCWQKSGVR